LACFAADASQRVNGVLYRKLLLAYRLQNPPANGKQGLVAGEMSQTLLINKKQRKTTKNTPLTLLSISYLTKEYVYFNEKLEEPLKNLKTSYNSFLDQNLFSPFT
jgi:hypothetical protein